MEPNLKKQEEATKQIKKGAGELQSGIREFFSDLMDLREGLDRFGTIKRIKENMRMRGANVWTLMCSIMIASIGLDRNSQAVIIGAMLISPLMSPILGIGLGAGINDRETLWVSAKHFLISIIIALITSTLYFLATPFGGATEEIIGRIQPTLLDVGIAFFGGLAGIISTSRKDISNAIPGVAIATALMPPLCVTGFGIAKLLKVGYSFEGYETVEVIQNSFYLFFLNAIFVALATYLIIRFLRFPYKDFATPLERRRNQIFILIVGALLIIPSVNLLRGVVADIQSEQAIKRFVEDNFDDAMAETEKTFQSDTFDVKVFLFDPITDEDEIAYKKELTKIVPNCKINFIKTEIPDINALGNSIKEEVLQTIKAQKVIQNEKDKRISDLQAQIDSLNSKPLLEKQIESEIQLLFPEITALDFYFPDTTRTHDNTPLLLIEWKDKRNRNKENERIRNYVKERSKCENLEVVMK